MAYGLKYTSTFQQIKSYSTTGEWQIKIYEEGYVGSTTEFETVRNSIKLERSGDIQDAIRPTTLTFDIYNESEGQFIEFAGANWGDFKVELIFDPSGTPITKFVGYNQTEIYTEPLEQTPYPASLKFTCGLKHLQYERFADSEQNLEETTKDANDTATVSASINRVGWNALSFSVSAESGDHDNHIISLEFSADNVIWTTTGFTIRGLGSLRVENINVNYVRLKVTTAEGSASVVSWDIKPSYSGQKALIEVIRLALNILPSPLNIREVVNVYEDDINSTTTDSMLNQIYVDSSLYRELIKSENEEEGEQEQPLMAYNVLNEIFKALYVHIFQWNGIWYLIRKQEYKEAINYYRDFNANVGTESTITVDGTGNFVNLRTITNENNVATDIILTAADSEKEIFPPVNRVKLTYKQQNLDYKSNNLTKNGYFKETTINPAYSPTSNGSPTYWTEGSGLDTNTYRAFEYFRQLNDPVNSKIFEFNPSSYKTSETLDSTKYIQYTKADVPVSTADTIQFNFWWRISINIVRDITKSVTTVDNYTRNGLKATFEVQFKVGTYYLVGTWGDTLVWGTTAGNIKFETSGLGQEGFIASNFPTQDRNVASEFTEVFPNLPETGLRDIEVRFYEPYTDVPS